MLRVCNYVIEFRYVVLVSPVGVISVLDRGRIQEIFLHSLTKIPKPRDRIHEVPKRRIFGTLKRT
jgi:hypothetical protein